MTVLVLETSALLRVLFDEAGSAEIQAEIASADRLFASRLLQVEAERAILRAALEHRELERCVPDLDRALRALWPRIDFVEMTRQICELAGRVAPQSRLRTLDAIHLATYHRVREWASEARLLTRDDRLAGLA